MSDFDIAFFYFTIIEWCTILSTEDNKKHVVHCKHLETELGDNVSENDIKNGSELVWRHRGIPYTIQVLGVHGKLINIVEYLRFTSLLARNL